MPRHIYILRWIAVFPGALLFAVLAMFPIHWGVMLIQTFRGADDDAFITVDGKNPLALSAIPPDVLERFGYAFFTPFVLISAAAWIAPRFKFPAGIGLAILWGIFFGCAVTYIMSRGQPSGWQWLHFALTCLLAVAGVVSGLFRAHKFQKEFCDTHAV